jgi:hypothetical protein
VQISVYRQWTETVKDGYQMCKEIPVSELSDYYYCCYYYYYYCYYYYYYYYCCCYYFMLYLFKLLCQDVCYILA